MIDIKYDFKALEKQLKSLPKTLQKRVVNNATRKGANVIAREMRRRAPVRERTGNPNVDLKTYSSDEPPRGPGYLKKHIRSVRQKKSGVNGKGAHFKVGPVKYAYYGLILEGGFEHGSAHVPARPWMRPAFDAKAHEASEAIMDGFWSELKKQLAKL